MTSKHLELHRLAGESFNREEVLSLWNRTQGMGLFKMDFLENFTSSENAILVGAFSGDELIGAAVVDIFNFSTISSYEQFGKSATDFLERVKSHIRFFLLRILERALRFDPRKNR